MPRRKSPCFCQVSHFRSRLAGDAVISITFGCALVCYQTATFHQAFHGDPSVIRRFLVDVLCEARFLNVISL